MPADQSPGYESKAERARTGEPDRPASGGKSRAPLVRASLDQAIAWIEAQAARLGSEEIGLDEAAGRVIALEIQSPGPVPPFDRAAADGYALRAADTVGAGDYNPLSLALVHPSQPPTDSQGSPGEPAGALPASAATPIVAGAALPRGADAVLPLDLAQANGASLKVFGPVPQGWGIVRQGQQLPAGARVVEAGRVLLPQHIGLLALAGIGRVQVVRRPRVTLFVFPPKPHGTEVNSLMLRTLIERDGGVVAETKLLEAEPHKALGKLLATALTAADADLMLIAGRSGHGADDFALRTIAECGELKGGEIAIHGLALRPGGSASMGVLGPTPVLLLPGDPLQCWSAYEMLAGPLIRRMAGRSPELPYAKRQAEVGHKIVSGIGVVELCRVRIVYTENPQGKLEPVGPAESGGLASAAHADGFVLVPAPLEGFAPGARVEVFLFEEGGREKSPG